LQALAIRSNPTAQSTKGEAISSKGIAKAIESKAIAMTQAFKTEYRFLGFTALRFTR
jgi:hypothetical protein